MAPGALFDRTYGPTDEVISRVIGVMMLYGAATEHAELIPTDFVSPTTAAAAEPAITTGCLGDVAIAVGPLPADGYWTNDPRTTEPARSIMLANDVGNVASPSPLLLLQGTADTTVLPARTHDLFDRLCATRQVTEYSEYDGATHDGIWTAAAAETTAWIADRFAGGAATDDCPAVEPPPEQTTTTASTAPVDDDVATTTAASEPADAVLASTASASVSPRFTG